MKGPADCYLPIRRFLSDRFTRMKCHLCWIVLLPKYSSIPQIPVGIGNGLRYVERILTVNRDGDVPTARPQRLGVSPLVKWNIRTSSPSPPRFPIIPFLLDA